MGTRKRHPSDKDKRRNMGNSVLLSSQVYVIVAHAPIEESYTRLKSQGRECVLFPMTC